MGPAVTWTLAGYAVAVALFALTLGLRVKRPRTAPGALAMLAVLAFGGLSTSVSGWIRCFEGGALAHPDIFWPTVGAWLGAAGPILWAGRRLLALARQARR
ncbi:MAG: hypothetical protein H6702_09530 [Myxococcales bacterium]|nr:hypothetical protein [Myxococcales bacterium]